MKSVWVLAKVSFLVLIGSVLALFPFTLAQSFSQDRSVPTTPPLGVPKRIQRTWGTTTPYFPVEKYPDVPNHCNIDQVNILQRHGARFPTTAVGTAIQVALAKIRSADTFRDPKLEFLKNFTYDLGTNDLVPFGAAESFDAGHLVYTRYSHLVEKKRQLPFVRTTSSSRVVQSASNWSSGFAATSNNRTIPSIDVIIPESQNNTLATNMCPNADPGTLQLFTWESIYTTAPLVRLNAGAPGSNLTPIDISALMSLCGFEVVAKERPSPICHLFNQDEFEGFGYFGDLSTFYGTGYGEELGPVQGVGYVNELIARLTNRPVRDNTQTNRTLDSSPITFPLDRAIYVDFSHDSALVAIYSALGLFRQPQALDPTRPNPRRTWVTSELVPFAGRLVMERLTCEMKGEIEVFIRMIVNDALQDLSLCGARKDGLCTVSDFVRSQTFATGDGEGLFERCFS